jgi:putative ABC transport system permease protein
MNLLLLAWNYLIAKPLNTFLNIFLLSLGIAVIIILMLFSRQLQEKISSNSKGIDLVVGAKGSPLQIILCNVFHIDFPTGNISLQEAEKISRNRLVKKAIPLALGDSYQLYRIIGSTLEYPELYGAELSIGDWWQKDMEVTLGANVAEDLKLKPGDTFYSAHGMMEGGHAHEDHPFIVKGILKRGGNVLDNLILCSVKSIWLVHDHEEAEHHHHEEEDHDHDAHMSKLVPGADLNDSTLQVSAVLLQYRSPIAMMQLPRLINEQSNMQSASPAFETARLFTILGVGVEILEGFAYLIIFISVLSIFIALYNSLKERKYDLAVMRTMGGTRAKLLISILLEGIALTTAGALLGMVLGHGTLLGFVYYVDEARRAGINGMVFYTDELWVLAGGLVLGLVSALIPAIQAYRTDISEVLAKSN